MWTSSLSLPMVARITRSATRGLGSKSIEAVARTTTTVVGVKKEPHKKKTSAIQKVANAKLNQEVPKRTAKVEIEDDLSHIEVPPDGELPQEFKDFHTCEFIRGCEHILLVDPSLYRVIVCKTFPHYKAGTCESNDSAEQVRLYWYALVSSVISQQILGAAAVLVENKFNLLFAPETPSPQLALQKLFEELRSAGLSNKKTEYVQNISQHFVDPTQKLAQPAFYRDSPEDEILSELVSLKGIGPWSAKMFLCFKLHKMNVFAFDDLGVARGAYRYLNRRKHILEEIRQEVKSDEALVKLLKRKAKFADTKGQRDWVAHHDVYIMKLGERFAPFQLVMMLILWRLSVTNVDVLQGTVKKYNNLN